MSLNCPEIMIHSAKTTNFKKENKMTGMVSAQHILVEQEFEAQDLIKKLNGGESFESLAMDFSKCPSGKSGGNLGAFGRGQMVKPFEDATYGLEIGQTSEPVKTQFGFHLIRRIS